jgi:hypothetical protein
VNRSLRTLVATALVALVLALGGAVASSPAAADEPPATCPFISVADSSKAATAVFSGTVDNVTKEPKPTGERGASYLHDVTVSGVYQGEVGSESVQVRTDKTPRQCSLGELEVGSAYLFFVTSSGDPWIAESTGGTRLADPEVLAKVEQLLGAGKPPVEPAPESAEFTPVNTEAPPTLSRAAAPGVALVLVGLLGLVLVRGLGRRG